MPHTATAAQLRELDMAIDTAISGRDAATLDRLFCAADIEALCADAAEHAFMRESGPRQVTMTDFDGVIERRLRRRRRDIPLSTGWGAEWKRTNSVAGCPDRAEPSLPNEDV
jgi:SpoVK/Ycf46/Vps4 family AAA+-type ATPase